MAIDTKRSILPMRRMVASSLNLGGRQIRRTALRAIMSGLATCRLRRLNERCALTGQRVRPRQLTFTPTISSRRNRQVTKAARRSGNGTEMPSAKARSIETWTATVTTQPSLSLSGAIFGQRKRAIL